MRHRGKEATAVDKHSERSEALADNAASQQNTGPIYRVAAVEGRGQGVLAACSISCGELILAEHPVMAFNSEEGEPTTQFEELSAEMKEKVMSLHDQSEGPKCLDGVLFTNALPRGASYIRFVLCLEASRFNHSCSPNCDYCWDERTNEVRIYASAEIEEGSELCISYMDVREAQRERCGNLSRRCGFACNCSVCSLDVPTLQESDRRRLRMKAINLELDASQKKEPLAGLKLVEELLDLYNEECLQLKSYGKKACYYGYQFALLRGDMDQAKWWIGRAYAYSVYCHGEHHEQTERLFAYLAEPESHPANKTALRSGLFKIVSVLVISVLTVKISSDLYDQFTTHSDYTMPDGLAGKSWLPDFMSR
jgi:hypothetical protein